jgi:hypothetical protein
MDLMGSDAAQSEEDMHRMWGDGIQAVKGQHARITYDDFLLLMKGQTKETPSHELELEASGSALVGTSRLHAVPEAGASFNTTGATRLSVVPETSMSFDDSPTEAKEHVTVRLASGDVAADGTINVVAEPRMGLADSNQMPDGSPVQQTQSAPTSPADHKRLLNMEMGIESPVSMDEDDDLIVASGPGVPGSSASLTPPMSPSRGAADYATPSAQRRAFVELSMKASGLELPSLPIAGLEKPPIYTRRRSKSMDDDDSPEKVSYKGDDSKKLSAVAEVAEVIHDMILPETDHTHGHGHIIKDESKSALVINRQLYRAHRHMRLAVLEASKRFEEQQAEHAKEVILAAREEDDSHGMIQAGLVMRHGHKKQVSSQAIRSLLETNRIQQQALVEKANRRGGRGRRSRKKTISDMSGMLSSMGAEDFNSIAQKALAEPLIPGDTSKLYEDIEPEPNAEEEPAGVSDSALDDLAEQGSLRAATVPGEFRKTSDPFGRQGRYGAFDWN